MEISMNYKSRIIKKASAAIVARLVMRYIPIIIKRLGKTIGPGGVAKLVDAVVQFITSKSKVGEQDARSAAEQYLKEHPEVIHPTGEGYRIIVEKIFPTLEPLLERNR